jgi:hypothetical protein
MACIDNLTPGWHRPHRSIAGRSNVACAARLLRWEGRALNKRAIAMDPPACSRRRLPDHGARPIYISAAGCDEGGQGYGRGWCGLERIRVDEGTETDMGRMDAWWRLHWEACERLLSEQEAEDCSEKVYAKFTIREVQRTLRESAKRLIVIELLAQVSSLIVKHLVLITGAIPVVWRERLRT